MPKGKKKSTLEKWLPTIAAYRAINDFKMAEDVTILCQSLDDVKGRLMAITKKFRRSLNNPKNSA
jgi:hypothetical protein